MTWVLVIAALALAGPAAALASGGGGSAGDQQYTDPFAGTSNPTSTHSQTSTATTPAATAPATATAPVPAPATVPATSTAPPPATPAQAPPTGGSGTATSTRPTQLPFTGYDSWVAAGLGAAMVAGGLVMRRRLRRA
jgi:hypothetical protein